MICTLTITYEIALIPKTLQMIRQHWRGEWFGDSRQKANFWATVDQDFRRHTASLGQYYVIVISKKTELYVTKRRELFPFLHLMKVLCQILQNGCNFRDKKYCYI